MVQSELAPNGNSRERIPQMSTTATFSSLLSQPSVVLGPLLLSTIMSYVRGFHRLRGHIFRSISDRVDVHDMARLSPPSAERRGPHFHFGTLARGHPDGDIGDNGKQAAS